MHRRKRITAKTHPSDDRPSQAQGHIQLTTMPLHQKLAIATLLTSLFHATTAFSSFNSLSASSFCQRHHHHHHARPRISSKSNCRHQQQHRPGTTGLNMMFDQLTSALTEVAQNFGGKQRYVRHAITYKNNIMTSCCVMNTLIDF